MKTAAEIEKTLKENLEKIEKNTETKPKQRYLTFRNVIAVALVMLVIWGVLSVLISVHGSGYRLDVAYHQFNVIVLHPPIFGVLPNFSGRFCLSALDC